MDIISNLLGLSKLSQLKRSNLHDQERSDLHLNGMAEACPETVSSLLLAMRKKSRIDQHAIIDADLTSKFSTVEAEIENSSMIHADIDRICSDDQMPWEKCRRLDMLKERLTIQNHLS